MKLYMLTLTGQGDMHIKFITEEAWNWLLALDENWQTPMPEKLLAQYREENDQNDDGEPHITIGSAFNDGALQVPVVADFFDMKEALDYIKTNGVEIMDTFEGYIY